MNAGSHGLRTVTAMAEYVDFKLAKAIICDMCTQLYPNEGCPINCEWMALLERNCKKDGE